MYLITIYNNGQATVIHEPGDSYTKVDNAQISREVNCFDSLSFDMYPDNPGWSELNPFSTTVEVRNLQTGALDFEGRVIQPVPHMDDDGTAYSTITCEGPMGYLEDSTQPYKEEQHYADSSNTTGLQSYLSYLLGVHNAAVEEHKHIYLGNVTLQTFETSGGVTKGVSRGSTWDNINDKIISVFGGEMRVRRGDDGKLYLDYAENLGTTRATRIEIARNMSSAEREIDPNSVITRLYPYGAKKTRTIENEDGTTTEEETEERLDITSVNNGKAYIDDAVAIEQYGIIEGYQEWDDVTTASALLSKGKSWLGANNAMPVSHSISAYDLSLLGLDYDSFQMYDSYPCFNPLIGLDETLEIVKQTINISSPEESTLEMGESAYRLSADIGNSATKGDVTYLESQIKTEIKNVNNRVETNYAYVEIATDKIVNNVTEIVQDTVTGTLEDMDLKNIKSTAISYQVSTSATTPPTGTWLSSPPSVPSGQYLWTRTVTTYTDGSTTTAYSIGSAGSPGKDGTDGKGVKSTAVTYQAGSSQTTAPTGTWSTTIPKLTTSAPYLWTRTVITYTDNSTSTIYSVSSTLESFQVGGTNILRKTRDFLDEGTDTVNGSMRNGAGLSGEIYLTFAVRGSSSVPVNSDDLVYCEYYLDDFNLGDVFTLSFYMKGTASNVRCYFYGPTGCATARVLASSDGAGVGSYSNGSCNLKPTAEWKRHWVTWQVNTTGDATKAKYILIRSDGNTVTGANCYICAPKFEVGTKATSWSPAPSDTDEAITDGDQSSIDYAAGINESLTGNLNDVNDQLQQAKDDISDALATITTNTQKITELTQTSAGWDYTFQTITETITELDGKYNTNYTETLKYIRFIDGEIWLGKEPDAGEQDFKVVISNERIRFLLNNVEVAYLSNNKLYITDGQILNKLQLGKFAFFPRSNGSLTFRVQS